MIKIDTLSNKEADKGAIVSILAYIFLSSMKIIISYITLSSALRADGLNNLTDIGASLAILIGLKSRNLVIQIIHMGIRVQNKLHHLLLLLLWQRSD